MNVFNISSFYLYKLFFIYVIFNFVLEKSFKEIMDEMKEFMEVSSKGVDNFVIKGEGGKKYIVEGEDLGFFCAKGGEVRGVEGGR